MVLCILPCWPPFLSVSWHIFSPTIEISSFASQSRLVAHQLKLPRSELLTCRFSFGLLFRTACPGNHRSDRICRAEPTCWVHKHLHTKKTNVRSGVWWSLPIWGKTSLSLLFSVWGLGQFLPNWDKQRFTPANPAYQALSYCWRLPRNTTERLCGCILAAPEGW